MELKKFVAETIENILAGISEAQEGQHGDDVASQLRMADGVKVGDGLMTVAGGRVMTTIHFDVGVTVTEESNAGAKISVVGIGIGGGLSGTTVGQNRIQFSLPLLLPKNKKDNKTWRAS
jgi:hypothetical protein